VPSFLVQCWCCKRVPMISGGGLFWVLVVSSTDCVGIDHRLLLGLTIGSFADQPSALSPVIESTIERTNTRLVGPAGTQKPHRNTQFTRTSIRRKMNSVLDGDERHGAYSPISWLYFTGLVHIQRSTGATYRTGSCPQRRPVRHDPQDSLSLA
jgi:hypothetical protein